MFKPARLIVLSTVLLLSCASDVIETNEVEGTIRSSRENFSFTPIGTSDNHWIHIDSYKAEEWNIFDKIHGSLLKQERKLKAEGKPYPMIFICISAIGEVTYSDEGVGHMKQWKSEILFSKINSAEIGQCK